MSTSALGLRRRTQLHWCKTHKKNKSGLFDLWPSGGLFQILGWCNSKKRTLPQVLLQKKKITIFFWQWFNKKRKWTFWERWEKQSRFVQWLDAATEVLNSVFSPSLSNASRRRVCRVLDRCLKWCGPCSVVNSPGKNLQKRRWRRLTTLYRLLCEDWNVFYTMWLQVQKMDSLIFDSLFQYPPQLLHKYIAISGVNHNIT